MFRPRWQKVLTDLWSNRTRSLLVVTSIAVGLFAIGVMATISLVIQQDMQRGYAAVNAANLYVQTSWLDGGMLDHLARLPGVAQAEGVHTFSLRVRNNQANWQAMDLQAVPDVATAPINRVTLLEGGYPKAGEIMLDAHKRQDLGAQVG